MRTGLYAAPAGNSRICSSVASFDSFMSITVPLMIDLKPGTFGLLCHWKRLRVDVERLAVQDTNQLVCAAGRYGRRGVVGTRQACQIA